MDSFFADVSEWQRTVDDTYPYPIFSFRSNDGTYRDRNFVENYRWACAAADAGRLACFVVYFYWRPDWAATVGTQVDMVLAQGAPHPKMISMIDVESGGNPGGDQSDGINKSYWALAGWLGNLRRVIGYANGNDFNNMWPTRPNGLRMIGAGYGSNPNLPGQIAHQYTNGVYSSNAKAQLHNHTTPGLERAISLSLGTALPLGASPFGNCDMNSADGLTPQQFAAACGISTGGPLMALTDQQQQQLLDVVLDIQTQLRGPGLKGWAQLGQDSKGDDLTVVDGLAAVKTAVTKSGQ